MGQPAEEAGSEIRDAVGDGEMRDEDIAAETPAEAEGQQAAEETEGMGERKQEGTPQEGLPHDECLTALPQTIVTEAEDSVQMESLDLGPNQLSESVMSQNSTGIPLPPPIPKRFISDRRIDEDTSHAIVSTIFSKIALQYYHTSCISS